MEEWEGYVEHIIFRNDENGYTVFELVKDEDSEEVCIGTFPFINEGEYIVVHGTRTAHALYGEQIKVESYEVKEAEDVLAVQRYLASGAIKGVGGGLAKRIVDKFGDDTFRIMEKEPERLSEVKGISEKKALSIGEQFYEKREMRSALLFLQKYGVSNLLAVKIYNHYRGDMYDVIRKNPYQLAEDISGIGFNIADEIGRRMGIGPEDEFRIRSGIQYVLTRANNNGHVYMPKQYLFQEAAQFLGVAISSLEDVLNAMMMERAIIVKTEKEEQRIYASWIYHCELNCARMLLDLNENMGVSESRITSIMENVEHSEEIELDERQLEAVKKSVTCGVSILTGGPGTGKTTTINAIIHALEREGLEIMLAAPTGRAAKRMTETTGMAAQTIHRLLEYNGTLEQDEKDEKFERNEWNQLETDVIVVDEMSMVDISLFHSLLKAVAVGTRLILVGDVNQLPSVGPGNVLRDIIRSGAFPVTKLTSIFRQAAESDIVVNAHRINEGENITMDNKSMDFFYLEKNDSHSVLEVVLWLVRDKMPKYANCRRDEVQVLCPMKKGDLGVIRCNYILQKYLNPESEEKNQIEVGDTIFREGDKVMQIRNNYQIEWEVRGFHDTLIEEGTGVFNGDNGVVKTVNTFSREVTVEYEEGKCVTYPYGNLDELTLAYAITIHKSQGSEYPVVILPLLGGSELLMNRNLLYTAVTRGKQCVTIVGRKEVVNQMIQNSREQVRYSSLTERIHDMIQE